MFLTCQAQFKCFFKVFGCDWNDSGRLKNEFNSHFWSVFYLYATLLSYVFVLTQQILPSLLIIIILPSAEIPA